MIFCINFNSEKNHAKFFILCVNHFKLLLIKNFLILRKIHLIIDYISEIKINIQINKNLKFSILTNFKHSHNTQFLQFSNNF